MKNDK